MFNKRRLVASLEGSANLEPHLIRNLASFLVSGTAPLSSCFLVDSIYRAPQCGGLFCQVVLCAVAGSWLIPASSQIMVLGLTLCPVVPSVSVRLFPPWLVTLSYWCLTLVFLLVISSLLVLWIGTSYLPTLNLVFFIFNLNSQCNYRN